MRSGALRAFAKPTVPPKPSWGPQYQENTIASHEKIASDLAYKLKLAVPPVLLWDCSKEPKAQCTLRSVSMVPFSPFYTWKQVLNIPGMVKQFVPSITKEASEICVFDTWIDNRDRLNAGNMILGMSQDSAIVRCAYIDFAQSMSFGWGSGPAPLAAKPATKFPGIISLDLRAMEETIAAIEALPEEEIKLVVERVPAKFTTPKRKACIIDGLLLRRNTLRDVLLTGNKAAQ